MENLKEFFNKIELDKTISTYRNEEKGIIIPLATASLLCRVDYLELTNEEKTQAEFQNKIEKVEGTKIKSKRPVPKNSITKNDKDKYTIVESEVMVYQIWNVTNQAGAIMTFTNKDDAIKLCEEINKKVKEILVV